MELSGTLHERLAAGKLDLVLASGGPRTRAASRCGATGWWIGAPRLRLEPDRPVPLIVYPPPGITRALALDALQRQGRAWHVACTSGSLNGLIAAARAGLGVMAHLARPRPARSRCECRTGPGCPSSTCTCGLSKAHTSSPGKTSRKLVSFDLRTL